ncbi:uncharacterized protein LOC129568779 [Sitodiplosis mosellana]|uniref:uncharacterized protein LOC129568779 n=1 Tax=Sitodiplosis mosellana TaxID=263140 RepID=UPI0024443CE8|nr:uncharacterized protein LOC129568779 [Sitodiplosis mosellana]
MDRWSKLKIGADLFVGKFDRNSSEAGESFTFWLSDFKTLWSECVSSKENLLQRLADDNPTLTISDEMSDQLLGALNTVGSATQVNTDIKPGDEEFKLQFKLLLGEGTARKFHWLLTKCEPQVFFDQITKSLLHQICDLSQLIDIVKSKDDEIRQHKLEGARSLERRRFITKVFNADEFKSQSQTFDCSVDDFRSIIGPSAKNLAKNEANEVVISPKKPTNAPNRGGRNRMLFRNQPFIKPGNVQYDESDGDEDEPASARTEVEVKPEDQIKIDDEAKIEPVETAPRPTMPIPIPKKRLKREFNW